MADLIADTEDLAPERRLRISIIWRAIEVPSFLPDETFARLQIGAFLGAAPLFSEAVYGDSLERARRGLQPGYFVGYDSDCEFLTGLKALVEDGERLDFEDITEPLFRLVIAPDVLNPEVQSSADMDWLQVLATFQWGGEWHGPALGSEGPSVRFTVSRDSLRRFLRDLVTEALGAGSTELAARLIIEKRFSSIL